MRTFQQQLSRSDKPNSIIWVLTNCVARPVTIGSTVKKLLRYNYIVIGTILQIYGFDDFMAGFVIHVDAHGIPSCPSTITGAYAFLLASHRLCRDIPWTALDLKYTADVYEDTLLALSGFQGYGPDARLRARTAATNTIESLVNIAHHLLEFSRRPDGSHLWIDKPGQNTIPELFNWDHVAIYKVVPARSTFPVRLCYNTSWADKLDQMECDTEVINGNTSLQPLDRIQIRLQYRENKVWSDKGELWNPPSTCVPSVEEDSAAQHDQALSSQAVPQVVQLAPQYPSAFRFPNPTYMQASYPEYSEGQCLGYL
ncbi:hypothetical protein K488DRAFT_75260, partial [Vararia minispora EC-137]